METALRNFKIPLSRKGIWQAGLTLIIVFFCIFFVKHEGTELPLAFTKIQQTSFGLGLVALLVSLFYAVLNAGIYFCSFAAVNARVSLPLLVRVFLKRNLLSVFLPAGGVSSLAFFNNSILKQKVLPAQNSQATFLYVFASYASLLLIALPVIGLLTLRGNLSNNLLIAFSTLLVVAVGILILIITFFRRGRSYTFFVQRFPAAANLLEQIRNQTYQKSWLLGAVVASIGVELCGMAHLWIACWAIGHPATLEMIAFGYTIATLLYAVSPLFRGLGAVELSLTYVLVQYGIPKVAAVAITLYYRFFEFWLPLLFGLAAFLFQKNNLLLRILPAFLIFLLGLVNIISVLTPAIAERLTLLTHFLSSSTIFFSNYAVIGGGILLLFLSVYLFQGFRNAWIMALVLTIVSILGHIGKAIDYEEALFGLSVLIVLIYTRRHYTLKSDPKGIRHKGFLLTTGFCLLLIYGLVGFYWLDYRHFNQNFTWFTALTQFGKLLLLQNDRLFPQTLFARGFSVSLQTMELAWLTFLTYVLLRPVFNKTTHTHEDITRAKELLNQYGKSSLDYFKVYPDKQLFFNAANNAFVAYKVAGQYAVVLENPVLADEVIFSTVITEFEQFCHQNGWQAIYYRIDEKDLAAYTSLGKKHLFIGQEGIISLQNFTLEGAERKSLRNAIRKVSTAGYVSRTYLPPLKEGLIQRLKAVSEEWLKEFKKQESAFTQGVFNTAEIKQQVVITVEDAEEKMVAFINVIPDYSPQEGTYDLIRKTVDAPNGVLDFLLVQLIDYFKTQNLLFLNLGMAPLSGLNQPQNIPEKALQFAYNNLHQFSHLHGLRFFKEKFADTWTNKYLVYTHDLDLVQAPSVLTKVAHY
ncbi:lysylphosphatidylglycerol synthetase family protein [Adhaeribacter arboris]|uniref:Phosphatidylglycerol lysyltransferase n=1 Tax=Adhaeribacter arboris TaxID=2072846 RepID=A0A2T2YLZ0_9BACT|nr:phosphatidylglycerol lysyltransferase domain-containing protein [Adhaeribacter arboris]PSR56509.1 lysylphosphatidylglycerol synthetase family protein [Adhaeribacter arboris]